MLIAAHPAPKLVQFCQSKIIGLVNKYSIYVGDVNPGFNYSGGDKDIILSLYKIQHYLFQEPFRHLAMGHGYPCLGHYPAEFPSHGLNVIHPVMDKVNLSLACQLKEYCLAYPFRVITHKEGLDGQAVLWRGGQTGYVL